MRINKILNETQLQTLQAVCNRLIPADDFPGAWDAGAGDYILRLLQTDAALLLPVYQNGLDSFDAEALAQFNRRFVLLDADSQDALLQAVERGEVAANWPFPPTQVLNTLINHTAEGYYADPGNGGNRDCVSWKMMGWGDERDL